jgi:hypothetical protein
MLAARPVAAASADPPNEAERQAWLRATAGLADAALERLLSRLEAALDPARRGSALVVSGQDLPGPSLEAAAAVLEGAGTAATAVAAAMTDLRSTLACVRPEAAAFPPSPVAVGELDSIAKQLRASAAAAGPFVERRWAAEATLTGLADALAALHRDDAGAALPALDRADASLAEVAAWEEPPPSLAYWVATTGALVTAARAIAEAALAGDEAAAAIAGEAYRAAAERARPADRALALAMAEAGSAISATPLLRLVGVLTDVTALRGRVASIADGSQ